MITLATVPRFVHGEQGALQRMALESWTRLVPRPEIYVIGDDYGVSDLARSVGAKHIQKCTTNAWGTARLDVLFERLEREATYTYLGLVSSDVVLHQGLIAAQRQVAECAPNGLLVARCKQAGELTEKLRINIWRKGTMRLPPPLAYGRELSDRWFMAQAHLDQIPIFDASEVAGAQHWWHRHPYSNWGDGAKQHENSEVALNRSYAPAAAMLSREQCVTFEFSKEGNVLRRALLPNRADMLREAGKAQASATLRIAEALRAEAFTLDKRGRRREAIASIDRCIKLMPQLPGVHLVKAIFHLNLRDYVEVERCASRYKGDAVFGEQAETLLAWVAQEKQAKQGMGTTAQGK